MSHVRDFETDSDTMTRECDPRGQPATACTRVTVTGENARDSKPRVEGRCRLVQSLTERQGGELGPELHKVARTQQERWPLFAIVETAAPALFFVGFVIEQGRTRLTLGPDAPPQDTGSS